MAIKSFHGEFAFLSNFSDSFILIDRILYKNAESAYQAYKCKNRSQREKLFTGITGSQAKKLGRKIEVRNDWEDIKLSVMEMIVKEKFKQNLPLRKRLLDTGDQALIEGNYWHDTFWGVCICDKCGGGGENHLGKILMGLRDYYRKQNSEEFEF